MSEDVLHAIENAVFKGTVIVGNTVAGDRARFNCHVVDDIAAGVALLAILGGNELLIKRGTYNPAAAIDIPGDDVSIIFESGAVVVRPDADNLFEVGAGRANINFTGPGVLDGSSKAGAFDLLNIQDSSSIKIEGLQFNDNPNGYGLFAFATTGNILNVLVRDCSFPNCLKGIYIAATVFPAGGESSGHRIENCRVSLCGEEGILFEGTSLSVIEKTHVVDCDGSNILIADISPDTDAFSEDVLLNEVFTTNSDVHGVELHSARRCVLVKVTSNINAGDGIHINDDENTVSSSVCRANTGNGIEITANADRSIISGNQLGGNTAANFLDGGTNTISGLNQV